jgi:hypothetical protein
LILNNQTVTSYQEKKRFVRAKVVLDYFSFNEKFFLLPMDFQATFFLKQMFSKTSRAQF